jgi:molybdenum cofactor guanylyltransferase
MANTIVSDLNGLVLSGGKSSRMGKDKGLIDFHGKPQREYLFDLLSSCANEVYTSLNASQTIPAHLNPLTDEFDFQSPINGILSALKKDSQKAWLVVAVDMPNVNEKVLHYLISQRDKTKTATCFYNKETALPEPLLTIWEPAAFPLLLDFVKSGKISPRDFLNTHQVKLINPPDQNVLVNINSPDQLPGVGQ